jgi:hypothetical protein
MEVMEVMKVIRSVHPLTFVTSITPSLRRDEVSDGAMTNGLRMKMATAGVGLTLVGNLLFGVMQRVEAIERERHQFQVAVEHRLTAIETKLDALLAQGVVSRQSLVVSSGKGRARGGAPPETPLTTND